MATRLGGAPAAARSVELFNANIFYPERGTLAFSDSMLVPALMAAPLLWLGVPQLAVHNLIFLSGFVAVGRRDVPAGAVADWQPERRAPRRVRLRVPALPLRPLRASRAADGAVDALLPVGVPQDLLRVAACATVC